MLARGILLLLALFGGAYGLVYLITCTSYFKDAGRVRRIAGRVLMALVAVLMAVALFTGILAMDHSV